MIDQPEPYATREQWLEAAVFEMRPLYLAAGQPVPVALKVSCGFAQGKKKAIGQCWSDANSEGHVFELFISPVLSDHTEVLATLAHEVAHACVGVDVGHKKPFKQLVTKIGLEGKVTATVAGPAFKQSIGPILEKLGPYPHARLNTETAKGGSKKQTTRLLKAECPLCGYTVRVTKKWVDEVGAPHCPAHGAMDIDGLPGAEEPDDETIDE